MCRLPRRSSGLLRRRVSDLPPGRIRDCDRRDYRGCAQSFRPGSWTFLPPAIRYHSARIMIEVDRSIVRRVRVQYRKGSESYTEVWGICFRARAACARLDRAISVQEPRLLTAEAAMQLPIFPANALVLSPER